MARASTVKAFEGWVSVGLFVLPGIPLWLFWEELLAVSGGYTETITGIVILSQAAFLLLLREPLVRWLVGLRQETDARRERTQSPHDIDNPAQAALVESLRIIPNERLGELAAMGAEYARRDSEQNLRVQKQRMEKETANYIVPGNPPPASLHEAPSGSPTRKETMRWPVLHTTLDRVENKDPALTDVQKAVAARSRLKPPLNRT
jgi:hypothetical protein